MKAVHISDRVLVHGSTIGNGEVKVGFLDNSCNGVRWDYLNCDQAHAALVAFADAVATAWPDLTDEELDGYLGV